MGCAVEAVAADAVVDIEFVGETIQVRLRLHGLMERGIENGYLRDTR